MVDKLKASLENLEPPGCPTCQQEMGWFRSQFIEYPPLIVEHVFVCSKCGVSRTRRVISADGDYPASHSWLMHGASPPGPTP